MDVSFDYQASIVIPAKNSGRYIDGTLNKLFCYLAKENLNVEVVLVINNSTEDEVFESLAAAAKYLQKENFKIIQADGRGKGDAIKAGIDNSSGEYLGFMDVDLPFELSFIQIALERLIRGESLVAVNRRDPNSVIEIRSDFFKRYYQRELNSLVFNNLTNSLLNLKCIDTQAGFKFFDRKVSKIVFNQDYCPRFLFDIELFLACKANQLKHSMLPAKHFVDQENSTVSLKNELFETFKWICTFYYRLKSDYYVELQSQDYSFTADDWGLTPSINRAIFELAKKNIIKNVSIMSKESFFNYYLNEVMQINEVRFGLHLNLTYNSLFEGPLSLLLHSINPFTRKSFKEKVRNEIESQLEVLKKYKVPIEYIDGHHHCHVFPVINNLVIEACKKYNISKTRVPFSASNYLNSKLLVNFFALLSKRKFRKNAITFSDFYYPNYKVLTAKSFKNKLRKKKNHEIITHPSYVSDFDLFNIKDTYDRERVKEYELLDQLFQK